ncbi:MAG: L,D-transpeptidase family protein [Verrucomicrobiales bacterium]
MKMLNLRVIWALGGVFLTFLRTPADELPGDFSQVLVSAIQRADPKALEEALTRNHSLERNHQSILHLAMRLGNPAALRTCLDYCADWRSIGEEGQNVLTMGVALGHLDAVAVLLENGGDANTVLASPASTQFRDLISVKWLREQLAYDRGLTPLMIAAGKADESMVRLLLRHQARRAVYTGRYKMPPVAFACRAEQPRITQLILGRDPDVNPDKLKIVISLSSQRIKLYKDDQLVMSCRCSTGRKGFDTPTGTFVVTSKHATWESNLYHVPMPYFLRLNGSAIGLHQGVVPGYPASHGCIRVPSRSAPVIYRQIQVGDPVHISR